MRHIIHDHLYDVAREPWFSSFCSMLIHGYRTRTVNLNRIQACRGLAIYVLRNKMDISLEMESFFFIFVLTLLSPLQYYIL